MAIYRSKPTATPRALRSAIREFASLGSVLTCQDAVRGSFRGWPVSCIASIAVSDGPRACNLCGNTGYSALFTESPTPGLVFTLLECKSCGLIATDPLPDDEYLEALYSADSYEESTASGRYCLDEQVSSADFTPVLHQLERVVAGRRLLDVGCGVGMFISAALERGWDAFGVEPSGYAGDVAAAKHGPRVEQSYLADSSFEPASFDALCLWYVMEHVADPTGLLEACHRYLKPGGVVFIAVPNARYVRAKRRVVLMATRKAPSVHPHEHLFHYEPRHVKRLLLKTGYQPLNQEVASPFMMPGSKANVPKRIAKAGATLLFRATGVNVAGILMYATASEG